MKTPFTRITISRCPWYVRTKRQSQSNIFLTILICFLAHLPHTIIKNLFFYLLPHSNSIEKPKLHLNINTMADETLLAKARKARFNDLPNFPGHPSEDVQHFLKSIKNITKVSDESNNHEILEIVRGKLTQSAELWFDNNEHTFKKWSDFEIVISHQQ